MAPLMIQARSLITLAITLFTVSAMLDAHHRSVTVAPSSLIVGTEMTETGLRNISSFDSYSRFCPDPSKWIQHPIDIMDDTTEGIVVPFLSVGLGPCLDDETTFMKNESNRHDMQVARARVTNPNNDSIAEDPPFCVDDTISNQYIWWCNFTTSVLRGKSHVDDVVLMRHFFGFCFRWAILLSSCHFHIIEAFWQFVLAWDFLRVADLVCYHLALPPCAFEKKMQFEMISLLELVILASLKIGELREELQQVRREAPELLAELQRAAQQLLTEPQLAALDLWAELALDLRAALERPPIVVAADFYEKKILSLLSRVALRVL